MLVACEVLRRQRAVTPFLAQTIRSLATDCATVVSFPAGGRERTPGPGGPFHRERVWRGGAALGKRAATG